MANSSGGEVEQAVDQSDFIFRPEEMDQRELSRAMWKLSREIREGSSEELPNVGGSLISQLILLDRVEIPHTGDLKKMADQFEEAYQIQVPIAEWEATAGDSTKDLLDKAYELGASIDSVWKVGIDIGWLIGTPPKSLDVPVSVKNLRTNFGRPTKTTRRTLAKIALEAARLDIGEAGKLYERWVKSVSDEPDVVSFFESYVKPLTPVIEGLGGVHEISEPEIYPGDTVLDVRADPEHPDEETEVELNFEECRKALNEIPEDRLAEVTASLPLRRSELVQAAASIQSLREYVEVVRGMVNEQANEAHFQNWLDEDGGKYRQWRCRVFGLEYTGFKREGRVAGKPFDVLASTGENGIEHVLIELKSPSAEILKIEASSTNNGTSESYSLSPSLARSIPQILDYRCNLESMSGSSPELSNLGLLKPPTIRRCIIVLGTDPVGEREKAILLETKRSLATGLEIWTYNDILRRLETTISNLERPSLPRRV